MTAATVETPESTTGVGRVVRVIGPVVDVEFPRDAMPEIFNALQVDVTLSAGTKTLTLEVSQHIGDNVVRAISMQQTDGIVRGATVDRHRRVDLGAGRRRHQGSRLQRASVTCLNLKPGEQLEVKERWPIHRKPPAFADLEPKTEMLETGVKVHRPARPVRQGWQDRPVRRCRRRQDRADPGNDHPRRA